MNFHNMKNSQTQVTKNMIPFQFPVMVLFLAGGRTFLITMSKQSLRSIQSPIQLLLEALSPEVKQLEHEDDF